MQKIEISHGRSSASAKHLPFIKQRPSHQKVSASSEAINYESALQNRALIYPRTRRLVNERLKEHLKKICHSHVSPQKGKQKTLLDSFQTNEALINFKLMQSFSRVHIKGKDEISQRKRRKKQRFSDNPAVKKQLLSTCFGLEREEILSMSKDRMRRQASEFSFSAELLAKDEKQNFLDDGSLQKKRNRAKNQKKYWKLESGTVESSICNQTHIPEILIKRLKQLLKHEETSFAQQ